MRFALVFKTLLPSTLLKQYCSLQLLHSIIYNFIIISLMYNLRFVMGLYMLKC